jgi:predicted nucleic acid-binding protein
VLTVDTNVLVYAADVDSQFHAPCRNWLERQRTRPDAWYTTWGILYEFLRVTTHPRVMRRPWTAPAAWKFVAALLASPGLAVLVPTERHADVAEEVILELPHLSGNLCTMRTRQFSCASTASGGSALGIPISINSNF